MLKAMYSGVSGMRANQTKLDVIGNNIANVGTTAFKKSSTRLNDYFYQTLLYSSSPTENMGGTNSGQVGTGVKVSAITKIMNQGVLQATGRPSDLAIDGDGFFPVVKNGVTLYTRDGSFNVDTGNPDGNVLGARLVTGDGHILQGMVSDNGGDPVLEQIIIPLKAISPQPAPNGSIQEVISYNISNNGSIEFLLSDGQRTTSVHEIPADAKVGDPAPGGMTSTNGKTQVIRVYTFQNQVGLESMGNNLYSTSPNSGNPILSNSSSILQGALEMSNVDLSEEFSEMILTTKAFQASSKMITTSDEILTEIINLKR